MHSYLISPLYLPFQILHTREKIYHLMIFIADRLLQTNFYLKNQITIAILYYGY